MFVFGPKHSQLNELWSAASPLSLFEMRFFHSCIHVRLVRQLTSVLKLNHLPFPLSLHPIPTPYGAHTWAPSKPNCFLSNEHPSETQSGFKCRLFIGQWLSRTSCWRRIGQNQSVTSEKFYFLLLLTSLDLSDNNVSNWFQINVAWMR